MTEQSRRTGRFVTNGSAEAHAALISRIIASKRESPVVGIFAPTPAPPADGSPVHPEGGFRVTAPTPSVDPSSDHSQLIGELSRRRGRSE